MEESKQYATAYCDCLCLSGFVVNISKEHQPDVEAVEKGRELFLISGWSIINLKIASILKIWSAHHRKHIQILRRSGIAKRVEGFSTASLDHLR